MFRAILVAMVMTAAPLVRAEPKLQQVATIDMSGVEGRFDHFAADVARNRIYVSALGNGSVEVLDTSTNARAGTIKDLKGPTGIAYIPKLEHIVVAAGGDGACRFYDKSLGMIAIIRGLDDADNVRYCEKDENAYVGYGNGALAVLGAKIVHIKLAAHPESFQLETTGHRIFVNVPQARQVAVVDREKAKVIDTWPLDAAQDNFPMALDEEHHRLFIGCRKPAKMLVLDTEAGKTIASIDCVGDTDDLFYDGKNKRIYISGGEGAISVIAQKDADHYEAVDRIPTAAGARTSLFIPQSGMLYVAVPHRGEQHAEIRVYKTVD